MVPYTETTQGVTIRVQPFFLEERSNVLKREFFFVYFIVIENHGTSNVQLLRRRWQIHDSAGEEYVVEGDGVVGQQPVIAPGANHQYNSFCVLKSFEGSMEGTYLMQREDGSTFEAVIPRFSLRAWNN
ncbi:MAG: Co2+/Mg2+ efflux protein ApaG [Ignavibacteriae bacterium]|nr:Co2+/Mg2+ efflux protein ApaG [Ignavibacteriota bacterium]